MDIWKISKNSDSATQDALTGFDVFVNMTTPSVKSRWVNTYGINGSIDLSEALGNVTYSDREISLILVTQQGRNDAANKVDLFLNTYVGDKIRLHNTTQGYMLIGRITDVVTEKPKGEESYKLICTVVCEPLRYATTYTPSASGLDSRPAAWSENLWSTANVIGTGVTSTGGSFTLPVGDINGYMPYMIRATALPNGKLARIYLQNLVNCTVEIQRDDRTIGTGAGSHIYLTTGGQSMFIINVYPIDKTQQASFGCVIRTIDATTINNGGKAVPIQIDSTYVPNVNYPVKMFLNGTIFTVKPEDYSGTWKEYAPAMLKTGSNNIATFVDYSGFDPSDVGSSGVLNIRYRGGVL